MYVSFLPPSPPPPAPEYMHVVNFVGRQTDRQRQRQTDRDIGEAETDRDIGRER